jgi:hypothetical protein
MRGISEEKATTTTKDVRELERAESGPEEVLFTREQSCGGRNLSTRSRFN